MQALEHSQHPQQLMSLFRRCFPAALVWATIVLFMVGGWRPAMADPLTESSNDYPQSVTTGSSSSASASSGGGGAPSSAAPSAGIGTGQTAGSSSSSKFPQPPVEIQSQQPIQDREPIQPRQ